jgi:hypothetical protein
MRPQIYLLLFLLLLSLPKTLHRSHLSRSAVFKEAGEILKSHRPQTTEISLVATSDKIIFTHFYACLDLPATPNPWKNCNVIKVNELTPEAIIISGYDYLILTERDGGRQYFLKLLAKAASSDKEINKISIIWEKVTEKYGKVSLFAINPTL